MDLFLTLSTKNIFIHKCLLSLPVNNIKPDMNYAETHTGIIGYSGVNIAIATETFSLLLHWLLVMT